MGFLKIQNKELRHKPLLKSQIRQGKESEVLRRKDFPGDGEELARKDLEHEASERYKGFVVRSRLKQKVRNEAVKRNSFAREEETRRFPQRYIESVKSLDRSMLRSSCEMREAFQMLFHDRFAPFPDLPLQECRSYVTNLLHLLEAEATGCKELVTKCQVRDALKQVSLNKSPGLDGLPYEVYLRISQVFVPILTDVFNYRFAQGTIPTSIIKRVITLLKKGDKYV